MPYAVYEVTDNGDTYGPHQRVATLTDTEMLALGRLRGLRFQLLMSSALGDLLDKLTPCFYRLAESRMDRRLAEESRVSRRLEDLQGSSEPYLKG